MASPQLENGYTRIANELLEAICATRLTATEYIVLLTIIRKTYGYGKKKDRISLSQISLLTGLKKTHISRSILLLKNRNIVTPSGNEIGINKDISLWKKELPRQIINHSLPRQVKGVTPSGLRVTPRGNEKLPHGALQKKERNYTKETLTKERGETPRTQMEDFIKSVNERDEQYQYLLTELSVKAPQDRIVAELDKFISYWTEPNHSGTKQRWQMEKVFDVKRRLATWFSRVNQFQPASRGAIIS